MKRLISLLVAIGALVLLAPGGAVAQEVLSAKIEKKATLVDNGQGVLVTVTTTCPSGGVVLEAFVQVIQDPNQNTSQLAGLPVVCDGLPHTATVRAAALDTPFHTGKARVSGFILLTTGESISPTERIMIRN